MTEIDDMPVETETTDEPDDDSRSTYVHTSVIGVDGRNHTASCHMDGDATDGDVARALLRTAGAAAQMHSSGAYWELQKLIDHRAVQR